MVKTALSSHFAAKQTLRQTLQLRNVKPAPFSILKSISTHIHNRWSVWCRLTFWLVFGFASLQFFFLFVIFTKLKWKNTVIFTMQLCCDASDSMLGKISRTFQDCIVEFKDFSRIFGNPGLFKENYKIQGLFKTVRTLYSIFVCICIGTCNWPLPIGAFQDHWKQTMIN